MKSRLRKKYFGCKCTHDKSFEDMITDDPYPMYVDWFVCARQPRYNNRLVYDIENEINQSIFTICENCPCFTVSRECMREYRDEKKLMKKYFKKCNENSEIPFTKMDPSEELPF